MKERARHPQTRTGRDTGHHKVYLRHLLPVSGRIVKRNTTCGHHIIDAERVLGWLVQALQETFVGPGRDALVREIKAQLAGETKTSGATQGRLVKAGRANWTGKWPAGQGDPHR